MMRAKGKLVAKRNVRSMTTEELGERAKKRVVNKLGSHEFDKVKKQYSELVASKSQKCGSLIDGTIMGLINQNLTNREIRRVLVLEITESIE